ncbi:hypothetical protein [Polymorphobacter sp. PAMC 29334]|uniref:hypothetical protein n=1 Tax=Polymorphobacter sp. PAMC 29334 TaxID=2862331 RepID=UPI001D02409E|nr:hypothetical protein [Polymorphobacter sp. PAMC 29334]
MKFGLEGDPRAVVDTKASRHLGGEREDLVGEDIEFARKLVAGITRDSGPCRLRQGGSGNGRTARKQHCPAVDHGLGHSASPEWV